MAEIRVTYLGGDKYSIEVQDRVSATQHEVDVTVAALDRFGGGLGAERLLEESFQFLLEHEPKEAILRHFEISEIARYFPEYPTEIRRRLGS
jgi:hypothetical protein